VATDIANSYIAAVLEHLPEADLVLDNFHLVKWFNDKLTVLRRQLYGLANKTGKAVLKGSRWLLHKGPDNLKQHADPKKDEHIRLQKVLELNEPLAIGYYMKERFRLLFQCLEKDSAEVELDSWIRKAARIGIKIFKDEANKLRLWK